MEHRKFSILNCNKLAKERRSSNCLISPFLLTILVSPLVLFRPTRMIGVSKLPSMQALASYASGAGFTQLLTPSELILQNALLELILNVCERGQVLASDLDVLRQAWNGLSEQLPLLPPGGEQGGSGGSGAVDQQMQVDGSMADNGNDRGADEHREEGGNTGENREDGRGAEESGGEGKGVEPQGAQPMEVDSAFTESQLAALSQNPLNSPPIDWSQRTRGNRVMYHGQQSSSVPFGTRQPKKSKTSQKDNGDADKEGEKEHESEDDDTGVYEDGEDEDIYEDGEEKELYRYTVTFDIPDLTRPPSPTPPITATPKVRPSQSNNKVSF